MNTNELIARLVADLTPVRRLRPPAWRLAGWLGMSIPAIALVVATTRTRPDLAVKLADPVFMIEQLASLATALIAGWSALVAGVPGEARWKMWAPVVPLALWMASLGHQCWDEWVRLGSNGMVFHPDFMCVPAIAMISAVPSLAMVVAIRRGARVWTSTAVLWGSLAAAALANVGLR
ncbi:MAG: NrsF family protein, partial [Pseudomonas sp.]